LAKNQQSLAFGHKHMHVHMR